MSFLHEPGDLAQVPLAAVLLEVLNQRATGVLVVHHVQGASRVFLRDGVPVGAQSFGGFKPLGQALLASGLIDVDALGKSLAEMARTGRPQGEILVELGAVTEAQVQRALSEQQAGYLRQIAGLAAGRFEFDASAPVPAWTAGVRISPLAAIVDALEKPQAVPLVISALQPVAAGPIALASGYRQLQAAFGWSAAETALVERLQSLTTLDAFFADPGVAPERARAILAAMLLLGLAAGRSVRADALESIPGLVVDLADVAGVPVEPEAAAGGGSPADPPPAPAPPAAASPAAASSPAAAPAAPPRAPIGRRSDPSEARARRQRLLQRAMQNMGVGPLSGQPPHGAASRGAPAAPRPRAAAMPTPAEEDLRRALDAAIPRARSADLFERLGVQRSATREQVKAAYFQLAKQLHPDRFAAPALADVATRVKDLFAAVNEAYEVLSDDRARADYLARTSATAIVEPGGEPGRASVDFEKAEACARTRDFAKARGFYEAALRADARAEYQVAYAWMLLQDPRGDRARARTLAEAALRDPTCLDRAALVGAVLARDEGDDERAERLLHRALSANPKNGEADRELRALEARKGRPRTGGGLSGLFRKK
ncbi:MAG TPA: DnaJ domain-containing protein [Anaeromyxobacteraceae bacterium]|nr:DnaJ domain-containing protein [Anaeromyxobacteraceae bacterium]